MKNKTEDNDASASLDDKLQHHIGNKLKQYYDEIVSESVPDRFKLLLDQLEKREITVDARSESDA